MSCVVVRWPLGGGVSLVGICEHVVKLRNVVCFLTMMMMMMMTFGGF